MVRTAKGEGRGAGEQQKQKGVTVKKAREDNLGGRGVLLYSLRSWEATHSTDSHSNTAPGPYVPVHTRWPRCASAKRQGKLPRGRSAGRVIQPMTTCISGKLRRERLDYPP